MTNPVTAVPAAPSETAVIHFESSLSFETDCWDTHFALQTGDPGFVLLDVRSPEVYAASHIPGAVSLPQRKIISATMTRWPPDTLFVTYCAGPHCNGAARAAARIARLGRSVKIMAGGVTGWLDEGFPLEISSGLECSPGPPHIPAV
ncbi:MAG TPA: rhodanese-like domain-containing protein [Sphingomicrobium sp.]|nr:rhodanese-like domain-containing protein [Sphingomicrobium sp.]